MSHRIMYHRDEIICPWCEYVLSKIEKEKREQRKNCPNCKNDFFIKYKEKTVYSTARSPCSDPTKHRFSKELEGYDVPYLWEGDNWTIWRCEICGVDITIKNTCAGKEPRTEYPTIKDIKEVEKNFYF